MVRNSHQKITTKLKQTCFITTTLNPITLCSKHTQQKQSYHTPYPSVLDFWKKVGQTWFLVYFELDFCRLHSKNQVWNRLKIKFVQLDFWKKFQTRFFKNQEQMNRAIVLLLLPECLSVLSLSLACFIYATLSSFYNSWTIHEITKFAFEIEWKLKWKLNGILLPKLFWPTVKAENLQNFWDH